MTLEAAVPAGRGRVVAARLGFRSVGGRTHLATQHTRHPVHITRPFRFAGDPQGMATLYLQSSSGGLYGDDALTLDIRAGEGAAAHVTTQASSIVHHARGGETRQTVRLDLGRGAWLEYCPDPAILFAGARLSARVAARLAPGARLVLADAALTHDPGGAGAPFERYENEIRIEGPDGRALLIDRLAVDGADWRARCAGLPCHGSLIVAGAIEPDAVGAALSAALGCEAGDRADGDAYAGVSVLGGRGIVLARFLCAHGAVLSDRLQRAWSAARTALAGTAPAPRRK